MSTYQDQRVDALARRGDLNGNIWGLGEIVGDPAASVTWDALPQIDADVWHVRGTSKDVAQLAEGKRKTPRHCEPVDQVAQRKLYVHAFAIG